MIEGFTEQELAELDLIVDPEGYKFQSLLERYTKLSQTVDGYAFTIYDWDEDVSTRAWLDTIIEQSPPDVQARLRSLLEPYDQAFLESTVEVERNRDLGSWFQRLPKNPGPDLQSDIDSNNL